MSGFLGARRDSKSKKARSLGKRKGLGVSLFYNFSDLLKMMLKLSKFCFFLLKLLTKGILVDEMLKVSSKSINFLN